MSLKKRIQATRSPSPVVTYNKEEIELINFFVDEGSSINRAVDRIHETYRNPNSPYYELSLVMCTVHDAAVEVLGDE